MWLFCKKNASQRGTRGIKQNREVESFIIIIHLFQYYSPYGTGCSFMTGH